HGERHARHYQIDMIRCIFCGFCEEACPEDAVILGEEWEIADTDRNAFIYCKDRLLIPLEQKEKFRPGMSWPSKSDLFEHAIKEWHRG
ncbi:MAG TPA: 4Fe-4S binding protein, partial [bacterium]|nr:4Fe-4S binding protein [bacterium]